MAIKGYGIAKGNKKVNWHTIRVPCNFLNRIDAWGMNQELSSRSEATRKLIELGLKVVEQEKVVKNEN